MRRFSIVITEALVLGTLAVTLNLTAKEPAPFFREVTLRVDKKEDLIPAIAKALHDGSTREMLKRTAKNFAFNHTSKQDAKATERVISLIERMMKERDGEMEIIGKLMLWRWIKRLCA